MIQNLARHSGASAKVESAGGAVIDLLPFLKEPLRARLVARSGQKRGNPIWFVLDFVENPVYI